MPVYSRFILRQTLAQSFLIDYEIAGTTMTMNYGQVGGAFANNIAFADTSLANQNLYENATIRHMATGLASGAGFNYRVSSFNTGSGAFVTSAIIAATVNFGDTFEVHSRLSALQKDLAIDDAIKRIRVRQEVGIMTGTGGPDFYDLEGFASPHYVESVLDAYYFAQPGGSMTRDQQRFNDVYVVTTGTGRELRISPALGASMEIVLDAILELTLGAVDAATVNIPDDRWIVAGAAAKCYDMMIQSAPGQNAGELTKRRAEAASEFSRLSGRFAPEYTSKVRLDEPESDPF